MTGEEFTRTFCRWVHLAGNIELLAIKEKSNNDCFFWKDRCTVYNARPTQCRTYPFWEGFLADEAGWKTGTEDCPGINSGRLYTSAEIEECIAAERAEPPLARKKSDG
jgi:Fe-S-cluster containining protein